VTKIDPVGRGVYFESFAHITLMSRFSRTGFGKPRVFALSMARPKHSVVVSQRSYSIDNCGRHNSFTIKRPARMASRRLSDLISSFVRRCTPVLPDWQAEGFRDYSRQLAQLPVKQGATNELVGVATLLSWHAEGPPRNF
jgi:hypothetical protein